MQNPASYMVVVVMYYMLLSHHCVLYASCNPPFKTAYRSEALHHMFYSAGIEVP